MTKLIKTETFAIIANKDTSKERSISTFQVVNDDMNKASKLSDADIGELLHVIADGGVISAVSVGITELPEQSEDEIEAMSRRIRNTFTNFAD